MFLYLFMFVGSEGSICNKPSVLGSEALVEVCDSGPFSCGAGPGDLGAVFLKCYVITMFHWWREIGWLKSTCRSGGREIR